MSLRGVAISVLALALTPTHRLPWPPMLCPFLRLTGRPCPACGLTRSWQAAAHLRARESVVHHPLGILTLAGAAWFALDGGAEARLVRTDPRLLKAALAAWLMVWFIRVSRSAR